MKVFSTSGICNEIFHCLSSQNLDHPHLTQYHDLSLDYLCILSAPMLQNYAPFLCFWCDIPHYWLLPQLQNTWQTQLSCAPDLRASDILPQRALHRPSLGSSSALLSPGDLHTAILLM